jgi:hypothetical protein
MSFSIANFIMGLIAIGIGIWLIRDAFHINHHILFLGWVEQKYGSGTGTNAYQLLGVAMCIFGVFVALGFIDLFSNAFGTTQPTTQQTVIIPSGSGRSGGSRVAD